MVKPSPPKGLEIVGGTAGDEPEPEPEPKPEPKPEPNPCAKGHRGPFIVSGMFRTCRACGSTSMGH
jgi:hypothetical protein